jgi:hypothetical protein
MASAKAPRGPRSHRPTTTLTPDVEPTPAIRPSNRCRVIDAVASLLVRVDEEHPVAEIGKGHDDHQGEQQLHAAIVSGRLAWLLT